MADLKDAHIVEIPVDEEHQQKQLVATLQHHPLAEISRSSGHLLLLKLWQREENLCARRIASKESRLDSVKQVIFHLCCFFLLFHALFTVLVFTSSVRMARTCGKWWIPSLVSLSTSLVFVVLVHANVCRYWEEWRQLSRERADARAITRCIQELRMKGSSFDLSKEPLQGGKKLKSSSVEVWPSPFPSCSYACCDARRKTNLQTYYGARESTDSPNKYDASDKTYTGYLPSKGGMKQLVRVSIIALLILGLQRIWPTLEKRSMTNNGD